MITIFDLGPSNHPQTKTLGVSPFVRTVIFILRYKKLDYEIKPIFDIAKVAQEVGASPTLTTPTPKYTVPFIKDSTTGKVVSDSTAIAEYLDTTYPETPSVVPGGSRLLHKILQSNLMSIATPLNHNSIQPFLINTTLPKEIREIINFPNATPEQVSEAFKQVKETFETFNGNLNRGESYRGFVMGGDKPTFGDFSVVAIVYPVRFIYGEESEQWKDVKSWAGGWVGWEVDQILKVVAP
ncbi:hypothetical protein V5O48_008787 [Marasmius crinis-equi]|uniref:GST N-terminal domain-containing protein n=1 Tax=Marasmius crinis-equi TaxID=585013 RepID=A0ABR3FCY6_9AGAR